MESRRPISDSTVRMALTPDDEWNTVHPGLPSMPLARHSQPPCFPPPSALAGRRDGVRACWILDSGYNAAPRGNSSPVTTTDSPSGAHCRGCGASVSRPRRRRAKWAPARAEGSFASEFRPGPVRSGDGTSDGVDLAASSLVRSGTGTTRPQFHTIIFPAAGKLAYHLELCLPISRHIYILIIL
jgi:hypothetical protein